MAHIIPNPFKRHEGAAGQEPKGQQQDASLTTILATRAQRADFTLLLHSCTASMRKIITDTFDPRYSGLPSDARFDNALSHGKDLDLSKVDVEELDKQRKAAEDRIKELSKEEMQALKREALSFFDKWQESVLGRVGQVLNATDEKNEAQASPKMEDAQQVGENMLDENLEAPKSSDTKISEGDIKTDKERAGDQPYDDGGVDKAIKSIYRPIDTPLLELDIEKRRLVLHSVMLLLLSLEHYSAHSHVLLLYLASSLQVPVAWLTEDEGNVARGLLKAAENMNADKETKKKAEENASSRKWKVGLASVAGAAVIGITGGLAAPLVAAGIGTVMGGLGLAETAAAVYLGSVASSAMVVGGLFGAYGGRMTGKMMDEYAKEVEDFGFVPIHKWSKPRKIEKEYRRLRVAIGISGWLTEKEDVVKPWRVLSPSIEGFALKYEMESLLKLGNAITGILKTQAWTVAKHQIIKRTLFAALLEGMWPLALLKVSHIVDNPFSVAMARSDKAGKVLADALINRAQGERPVSLVGYSLGARVIYRCLLTLAERRAFGLVENVVLLGCPATSDSIEFRKMRSVVCGRLVNVYSENDYILGFLYRATAAKYGVAGLNKAEFVKGVENVDVSDIVSGHLRYRYLTGAILKRIGFEDVDLEEVALEEDELAAIEAIEEKEAKEHRKKYAEDGKDADKEAEEVEKEVEHKNKASMLDWATAKLSLGSEKAMAYWGSLGSKEEGEKTDKKEGSGEDTTNDAMRNEKPQE
ncbi:uncharacterized protein PV09_07252 [Verruconis gallopava]|uniref:DUF726-domain-containing protein n=1 Tax=Verruconis gallopava TaxID=253628 RepID=A0A0D2APW0_9PEZI|nr:uncharacterized protein PV09_07252 [Verruconis gallopava]KIW01204.1 hypothetical protein PV09_07252 [Verruconis gallopava]